MIAVIMFFFGAGLGLTMQVVVTAVQNSVERKHMGAATASVTFFRSMGGAIGTALFGAILNTRLAHHLAEIVPARGQVPAGRRGRHRPTTSPRSGACRSRSKTWVLTAFTTSMDDLFLVGLPFMAVALVIAIFMREVPLIGRTATSSRRAQRVGRRVGAIDGTLGRRRLGTRRGPMARLMLGGAGSAERSDSPVMQPTQPIRRSDDGAGVDRLRRSLTRRTPHANQDRTFADRSGRHTSTCHRGRGVRRRFRRGQASDSNSQPAEAPVTSAAQPSATPTPTEAPLPDPVVLTANVEDGARKVTVDTLVKVTAEAGKLTKVKLTYPIRDRAGQTEKGTVRGAISKNRATLDGRRAARAGCDVHADHGRHATRRSSRATKTASFTTHDLSLDQQTFPTLYPLKGSRVGVGHAGGADLRRAGQEQA